MFMAAVAGAPKHRQAEEQCGKARRDRSDDISGGEPKRMPLDQQSSVERECGEGREAAEDAGREQQPHVLRMPGRKAK